VHLGNY